METQKPAGITGEVIFRLLFGWLASAVSIYFAAWLLDGITVKDFGNALLVAIVLGLVNSVLKPILLRLSFPLVVLSLGLFLLVINAVTLYFVADILPNSITVDGFWSAFWGALIISLITAPLSSNVRVKVHRGGPPRDSSDF